jgi:hypothetical protein
MVVEMRRALCIYNFHVDIVSSWGELMATILRVLCIYNDYIV